MGLARKEIYRVLKRKGMDDDPDGSVDHKRLAYIDGGVARFRTCVSHGGGKDLGEKLIRDMARECHLTRNQFIALIKCTISKEEYRQILVDKGVIKPQTTQEHSLQNKISRVLLGITMFFNHSSQCFRKDNTQYTYSICIQNIY